MPKTYPDAIHTQDMGVIVAWTGHRPEVFDDPLAARSAVDQAAARVRATTTRFLVGGQRGVDTWAALAALNLGLPFELVLPHPPEIFAADWSDDDRATLDEMLQHASSVEMAAGYSERNRRLATSADLLTAVWTGTRGGGTAETIAFAQQAGVRVREILLRPSAGAESLRGRGI